MTFLFLFISSTSSLPLAVIIAISFIFFFLSFCSLFWRCSFYLFVGREHLFALPTVSTRSIANWIRLFSILNNEWAKRINTRRIWTVSPCRLQLSNRFICANETRTFTLSEMERRYIHIDSLICRRMRSIDLANEFFWNKLSAENRMNAFRKAIFVSSEPLWNSKNARNRYENNNFWTEILLLFIIIFVS